MDRSPTISIIIPAFNVERYIRVTLQCVLDQTEAGWECIVVNDGSTDQTRQVVQEFVERDERFRIIDQPNSGAANARNFGIARIAPSSRFVIFLDSDDVWLPQALAKLRQAIDDHPDAVGAHGVADLIDDSGKQLDSDESHPGDTFADFGRMRMRARDGQLVQCDLTMPTSFETLYPVSRLYPSGLVMVRREALEKVGGFDTTFDSLEDWDFWLRLTRLGVLAFVNEKVIHYRRHGTNLTNNADCTTRNLRRLLSKHYFSKDNTPDQRRIVHEGFRAFHALRRDENARLAKQSWVSGNYGKFVRAVLKTCHHSIVRARGFPTSLGI